MDLSRSNFLRASTRAATGTAIGGLVGLGAALGPATAQAQELRIKDAKTIPSVCPFCWVGCATLVHTVNGHIINIEGDPRTPIMRGLSIPRGRRSINYTTTPIATHRSCTAPPGRRRGRSGTSIAPWIASPTWSKRRETKRSSNTCPMARWSIARPPFSRWAAPRWATSGTMFSRS